MVLWRPEGNGNGNGNGDGDGNGNGDVCHGAACHTANLRTKIMDIRGFYSNIILSLRGGIPRPIGICLAKFESSNLSRDNLSREIGRIESCHSLGLTRWDIN